MTKLPFEIGAMHYDDPPPDHIDDLEPLRAAGRFRFANRLAAWIEVEDGRITGHGYAGGGVMGLTRLSLGVTVTFAAIGLPDIQPRARRRARPGAIHTDRRRSPGYPGAEARQPSALRPAQGPDGVDHTRAGDRCRRQLDVRARRRQPVPPPLGLRQRREARGQGRPRRLQGLVPPRLRQAHAVGRRGLARDQDRRSSPSSNASCRRRSCAAEPSPSSGRCART